MHEVPTRAIGLAQRANRLATEMADAPGLCRPPAESVTTLAHIVRELAREANGRTADILVSVRGHVPMCDGPECSKAPAFIADTLREALGELGQLNRQLAELRESLGQA